MLSSLHEALPRPFDHRLRLAQRVTGLVGDFQRLLEVLVRARTKLFHQLGQALRASQYRFAGMVFRRD